MMFLRQRASRLPFLLPKFQSYATIPELQKLVSNNDIVVFMKGTKHQPQCGFSKAVASIMSIHELDYLDVNVLEDSETRENIKKMSDWPTIPQVYLKGEFMGGCDIMINMHQSGELEAALIAKGIKSTWTTILIQDRMTALSNLDGAYQGCFQPSNLGDEHQGCF